MTTPSGGGRSTTIGSRNFLGYDANDCFLAGDANFAELIGANIEQVVCLGWADTVRGLSSNVSVLGSRHHVTDAASSSITGGDSSTISGDWRSIIAGGFGHSLIGGPEGGSYNGILGGTGDSLYHCNQSAIVAGGSNFITTGQRCAIISGAYNVIDGTGPSGLVLHSSIGGGAHNIISSSDVVIGGGFRNRVSAHASTIAGGQSDTINSENSAIGGGYNNVIIVGANDATIAGGADNRVTNHYGAIAGGWENRAAGYISCVGGGKNNQAGGQYATIPGGINNAATGDFSFAAGRRAYALFGGDFVWADNNDYTFPSPSETNFAHVANMFTARATGGFVLVTGVSGTGASTSGAQLPGGSGSWSSLSDRSAKTNIEAVDTKAILEKLAAIPIQHWSYRSQDPSIRHIGPMAQDLHAAFGVGESEKLISTVDADGIALAAIQALYEKTQEIDQLRARMAELEDLIRQMQSSQAANK